MDIAENAHETGAKWWIVPLDGPLCDVEQFESWLSAEERHRADRYSFPVDRRRFVARHGLLRGFVGEFIGIEPTKLEIVSTQWMRPRIVGGPWVSLASSESVAMVGVSPSSPIGVDLERIRSDFDFEPLLRDHFSPAERVLVEGKSKAFFTAWTKKEAWSKALGIGLERSLSVYEVIGQNADLTRIIASDSKDGFCWSVALAKFGDQLVL